VRIAFFSDTHLGHRRFAQLDDAGLNAREVDVMQTFRRVLQSIQERDPDVVLHGGDFFDVIRPSNLTLSHALHSLLKFQEQRHGRPFLVVAGNHEMPKVKGTGCALQLFQEVVPGFHAVYGEPKAIPIGEGQVVHCVPSNRVGDWKELRRREKGTLLLMHGLIDGIEHGRPDLSPADIEKEYEFAFLGDYHIHQAVRKTVVYVGSTDYVGTNFWKECTQPKGWLEFDTRTREGTFHRVDPVRRAVELEPIDARGLTAEEVGARMVERLEAELAQHPDEKAPIVRQLIKNAWPDLRREVPFQVLQECRRRCLDYDFVTRVLEERPGEKTPQEQAKGQPLVKRWEEFAKTYSLKEGVNRDEFIQAGKDYLAEARSAAGED